jgi:threonine dehydrogenase-like Zn-dependent dehydrogenase
VSKQATNSLVAGSLAGKIRPPRDRRGVGVAAVFLGRSMNFTVVDLSRDAEKRTKLKALGADFVFDPEDRNLPRSVSAAISPKKVHLAVDCVGGKLLSHVISMLDYGGRSSIVGRSAGPVPEFIQRPCCSTAFAWAVSLLETIPLRPPRPHRRRLSIGWRPLTASTG